MSREMLVSCHKKAQKAQRSRRFACEQLVLANSRSGASEPAFPFLCLLRLFVAPLRSQFSWPRALCLLWFAPWLAVAAGPGEEAVVIYNTALEDSKAVVAHYVAARQVPANQVIGLALPRGETKIACPASPSMPSQLVS